ncbi:hypothetical protein [Actinokineospora pegani]|uniref:hypothetical protein n=1 Tax=Actinokineospora pegani TaxID=2654637 RepID=UPI0012EA510A|nr:hypothetical protein [Actinokineospora pegani]
MVGVIVGGVRMTTGGNVPGDIAAIGSAMSGFLAAASSGQFAVNDHGGKPLLEAIAKMRDWLAFKQGELTVLEQEPMLGGTNAARVMKPYVLQVATDAQGFITQLVAFDKALEEAEAAIKVAMSNYREVDEASARSLGT